MMNWKFNGIKGRLGDYVIQTVAPGFGNVVEDETRTLQIRRHKPNNTSNTPKQMAYKMLFAKAVAAWRVATPEVKEIYERRGKARNITGYNAWISEYIATRKITGAAWDNGNTVWDGGNTIWQITNNAIWDGGITFWDNGNTEFKRTI